MDCRCSRAVGRGDVVPAVQFGVLPAQDQVAALLRRDPAAHVSLGDPYAVPRQLSRLRETGAEEQATALADRPPGQACSSSSASKRAAKIGPVQFGSAARRQLQRRMAQR